VIERPYVITPGMPFFSLRDWRGDEVNNNKDVTILVGHITNSVNYK